MPNKTRPVSRVQAITQQTDGVAAALGADLFLRTEVLLRVSVGRHDDGILEAANGINTSVFGNP